MSDPREIAREKAQARERRLRLIKRQRQAKLLVAIAAFILLIAAFIKLYNSHFFDINRIRVLGNIQVPTYRVIEISGAKTKTNLLRAPTTQMRENLLKNPWIKAASLNRRLPRTLEITVVERKAFAAISYRGSFYVIDDQGFVLEKEANPGPLVPITDVNLPKIKVGEKLSLRSLDNAVASLKGLDKGLRTAVYIVAAPEVDRLSLYTKSGVEILYGKAEKTTMKNQVIAAILRNQKGKVVFIDVRAPANPVVKNMETEP